MIPVHYEDYTWVEDGLAIAEVENCGSMWGAPIRAEWNTPEIDMSEAVAAAEKRRARLSKWAEDQKRREILLQKRLKEQEREKRHREAAALRQYNPQKTIEPDLATIDFGIMRVDVFINHNTKMYWMTAEEAGGWSTYTHQAKDLGDISHLVKVRLDQKQSALLDEFLADVPSLFLLYDE